MLRLRPTRLLALGGLVSSRFLYWKPLHTYLQHEARAAARTAQVQALQAEKKRAPDAIARPAPATQLVREARRLGLVKPGERLFIVRGIGAWRHKNH